MKKFLTLLMIIGFVAGVASAEERRAKSKINPVYPEMAKRMNVNGTVRLEVTVKPTGEVKTSKPIGGHPLLVTAAQDAVAKWRYEPASAETVEIVEIRFNSSNQ